VAAIAFQARAADPKLEEKAWINSGKERPARWRDAEDIPAVAECFCRKRERDGSYLSLSGGGYAGRAALRAGGGSAGEEWGDGVRAAGTGGTKGYHLIRSTMGTRRGRFGSFDACGAVEVGPAASGLWDFRGGHLRAHRYAF